MATNYTGNPDTSQPPAVAPSPGTAPELSLPQDLVDDVDAASVAQLAKTSADYIAFLQKAARFTGEIASDDDGTGFSNVVHEGTGTGTVTPNGGALPWTSNTTSGWLVVIKITLAGVVGVAKYQASIDGGATYAAEATTAASIIVSGINISLAGTFDAGDLYAFRQIDGARVQGTTPDGSLMTRPLDHLGYPMGRIVLLDEPWLAPSTALTVADSIPELGGKWGGGQMGATMTAIPQAPTSTRPYPHMKLDRTGNNAGDWIFLNTAAQLCHAGFTGLIAVAEWQMAVSATGAAGCDFIIGLISSAVVNPSAVNLVHSACFRKLEADATWFCVTSDGATATTQTTGLTLDTNMHRFRVELIGSASFLGQQTARFFVDGVLVAALTTNLPGSVGLYLTMSNVYASNSGAADLFISPLRFASNQLSSEDGV